MSSRANPCSVSTPANLDYFFHQPLLQSSQKSKWIQNKQWPLFYFSFQKGESRTPNPEIYNYCFNQNKKHKWLTCTKPKNISFLKASINQPNKLKCHNSHFHTLLSLLSFFCYTLHSITWSDAFLHFLAWQQILQEYKNLHTRSTHASHTHYTFIFFFLFRDGCTVNLT